MSGAKKDAAKEDGDDAVGGALLQAYVDLIDAGNPQAQLILNVLTRFLNWRTGVGRPNYKTLAELAKCSRKTVQRFIGAMEENYLIEREKRFDTDGNGRRTSNTLTLVGYAEWFKAVREGGTVAKPRAVIKRRPYGQSVHRGKEKKPAAGNADPMANLAIAPMDNMSIGTGQQVSIGYGQQVSTLEPFLEPLEGNQDSPPPPRKRGARERESLIAQVRAAVPECARAVDKLLAPLLASVRLDAPDPGFAMKGLAEFAEKQSDAVLAETLVLLTTPGKHYRRFSAKVADITDAIRVARSVVAMRDGQRKGPVLWRGTPEFAAAIAKVAEQEPAWAEALRFRDRISRSELKSYGVEQVPA